MPFITFPVVDIMVRNVLPIHSQPPMVMTVSDVAAPTATYAAPTRMSTEVMSALMAQPVATARSTVMAAPSIRVPVVRLVTTARAVPFKAAASAHPLALVSMAPPTTASMVKPTQSYITTKAADQPPAGHASGGRSFGYQSPHLKTGITTREQLKAEAGCILLHAGLHGHEQKGHAEKVGLSLLMASLGDGCPQGVPQGELDRMDGFNEEPDPAGLEWVPVPPESPVASSIAAFAFDTDPCKARTKGEDTMTTTEEEMKTCSGLKCNVDTITDERSGSSESKSDVDMIAKPRIVESNSDQAVSESVTNSNSTLYRAWYSSSAILHNSCQMGLLSRLPLLTVDLVAELAFMEDLRTARSFCMTARHPRTFLLYSFKPVGSVLLEQNEAREVARFSRARPNEDVTPLCFKNGWKPVHRRRRSIS